jgi:hypothetical protein
VVLPFAWELFHFTYDPEAKKIKTETAGVFTQYPLKLAWGITIHKSQGKTFERAIIDLGRRAFAAGQTYVALSRCTALKGLSLARAVRPGDVMTDWRIVRYVTGRQYKTSDQAMPLGEKIRLIEEAIKDCRCLEMTYLTATDEKSRRTVRPLSVGDHKYNTVTFKGLEAHCLKRGEKRMFRVDRILELKVAAE